MVYPCNILLLSLHSHNFPVNPLHPTKELFCALQILIKALDDAFILMETRFYLETIFLGYTRYIPGISTGKAMKKLYGDSRCAGTRAGRACQCRLHVGAVEPPSAGESARVNGYGSRSCQCSH